MKKSPWDYNAANLKYWSCLKHKMHMPKRINNFLFWCRIFRLQFEQRSLTSDVFYKDWRMHWHTPYLILNQATSLEQFPNPGCYSPCSFPHLSHVAHLGTLNGAIKRWNSDRILNSWGIQALIHTHLFSPWEKLQANTVSWHWVVPPLARDNGRVKLFLLPFSICLITDFCALCAETSLQDSCSSIELFLSKSVFFGKKM